MFFSPALQTWLFLSFAFASYNHNASILSCFDYSTCTFCFQLSFYGIMYKILSYGNLQLNCSTWLNVLLVAGKFLQFCFPLLLSHNICTILPSSDDAWHCYDIICIMSKPREEWRIWEAFIDLCFCSLPSTSVSAQLACYLNWCKTRKRTRYQVPGAILQCNGNTAQGCITLRWSLIMELQDISFMSFFSPISCLSLLSTDK